ncbi:MAG: amidohydrolase family protein [Monoglobales bacterium]
MYIDIHSHAYWKPAPFVTPFYTPQQLIEAYDHYGIEKGVLLPVVNAEIYLPQSNEDILDMAEKYPDRFIPFCNIDPRALTNSPDAPLDKVLAYYKDKGCKGVGEVMPNMQVMDPRVQNLFSAAEKVGLPVIYDGSDQLDGDFGLYDNPGLPQLEHTLQRFPKLIILGHGPVFWSEIAKLDTIGSRGFIFGFKTENQVGVLPAGPIKEEGAVPKLLRKYPNLHLDLSDETAYNALTRDPEYGPAFLEEFQDRAYFGTDFCCYGMDIPLTRTLKEWKNEGRISAEAFEKISRENAIRLLNL